MEEEGHMGAMARTGTNEDERSVINTIRHTPAIVLLEASCPELAKRPHGSPGKGSASEEESSFVIVKPKDIAPSHTINQVSQVLRYEPAKDASTAALQSDDDRYKDDRVKLYFSGTRMLAEVDSHLLEREHCESSGGVDKKDYFFPEVLCQVEILAEQATKAACDTIDSAEEAFTFFKQSLEHVFENLPVAAFRTEIAYRTGLDIQSDANEEKALEAFKVIFAETQKAPSSHLRLENESLNGYILHLLARVISNRYSINPQERPMVIQFDIGLGHESNASPLNASPFQLHAFIKQYPSVPMVMLHAGYPFVPETSYLASTYPNVYLDLGLVFPKISQIGQERALSQALELCGPSKVMWCANLSFIPKRWNPEQYRLAISQMKETIAVVMLEYIKKGTFDLRQATLCVENILVENPRMIYGSHVPWRSQPTPLIPQTFHKKIIRSDLSSNRLERTLRDNKSIQFVRVCWVDFCGWMRLRIIPRNQSITLARSDGGFKLSISKAALAVLQNDSLIKSVGPAGEFDLVPDSTSLQAAPKEGHVLVMGDFQEKDGSPATVCPRTQLRRTLDLAETHGLTFRLGFEIEFVLMRRAAARTFEPLESDAHQWCSMGSADYNLPAMTVIEDTVAHLANVGIDVETIHPESAFGQYEVVLPALPPLEAVDCLVYARHALSAYANKQGLKMTLHPKPFAKCAGTAAHVHMSISSPSGSDPAVYEPFYAGILAHLRSIVAYTCSNPVSYHRVVDGYWAGGTWVAWGTQNRETPLRKIEDSHWELKCMDGIANPYLAMSAIIAAGLSGVTDNQEMRWHECVDDPASISRSQREELGITEKMPLSLEEALGALKSDEKLKELLGEEAVQRYLDVKEGEIEMLRSMDKDALRHWVIARY